MRSEWDSGLAARSSNKSQGSPSPTGAGGDVSIKCYLLGLSCWLRKHENGKVEATDVLSQLFEDYLFQRLLFACLLSHNWLTQRVKLCRSRINVAFISLVCPSPFWMFSCRRRSTLPSSFVLGRGFNQETWICTHMAIFSSWRDFYKARCSWWQTWATSQRRRRAAAIMAL